MFLQFGVISCMTVMGGKWFENVVMDVLPYYVSVDRSAGSHIIDNSFKYVLVHTVL